MYNYVTGYVYIYSVNIYAIVNIVYILIHVVVMIKHRVIQYEVNVDGFCCLCCTS